MIRLVIALIAISLQLHAQKLKVYGPSQEPQLQVVNIDTRDLISQIQSEARSSSITIDVPELSPSPIVLIPNQEIMSPEYQEAFPEIRVYNWDNGHETGVITISNEDIYINRLHGSHLTTYFKNDNGDFVKDDGGHSHSGKHICGVNHSREEIERIQEIAQLSNTRDLRTFGQTQRRYRLAAIATGEYYQANGNNNTAVNTHLIGSIAGIEAIYRRELNVTFTVLTPVLYNNPNTDPFIPDDTGGGDPRPTQASDQIVANFNLNSFDIGHVFHTHADGDGWSNGGIAGLGVVCQDFNNRKAAGWSGAYGNNGASWFSLAAHEFAHMFGAQHTFNGDGSSCTSAISETTAYEIGSGTTIMSYNGICDEDQNIPSGGEADSYFHTHSLQQMMDYIEAQTCGNASNSGNTPPTVEVNPCNTTYIIPKGTPFIINGGGSDADGDPVTYCWEQYDEDGSGTPTQGEIGPAAQTNTIGPLFRSFPPSSSPSRSFPDIQTLRNGVSTDPFQVLPQVNRDLNFRLTVRDNKGAFAMDDLAIQVNNVGPFRILSPNGGEAQTTADAMNITWSTGGTQSICDVVDIFLSIDDGISEYLQLADNVDISTGSFMANLPSSITSTESARIIIRCDDNDCVQFYDISDNEFSLVTNCRSEQSVICDTDFLEADQGDPVLNLGLGSAVGDVFISATKTLSTSSTTGPIAIANNAGTACNIVSNNYFTTQHRFKTGIAGNYTFNLTTGDFATIFKLQNLNPASPCANYVASSAITSPDGNGLIPSTQFSSDLEACTEYVMMLYSFRDLPRDITVTPVDPPAPLISINENPDPNYSYTYIAINQMTGQVAATDDTGDFSLLSGGEYQIYGIQYKASGPAPPANSVPLSWIGKSIEDILNEGQCILQSSNFKPLVVNSNCAFTDIQIVTQSDCNPDNNTYEVDLRLTFEGSPETGNININGGSYTLGISPQGIAMTGLESNGLPLDLTVFFEDDPSCETVFPNVLTAPENCCPFEVDLGDDLNVCEYDIPQLSTEELSGATYAWSKDGDALPFIANAIEISEAGTYTVEVTLDGCKKSDEIVVTLIDATEFDLPEMIEDCSGNEVSIDPEIDREDYQYAWTKDGAPFSTDEIITVSESGNYCLSIINENECSTTRCTPVVFKETPIASLGDDIPECEGQEVTLSTPTVADGNYEWYRDNTLVSNGTDNSIIVTVGGEYIVIVSNGSGCIGRDTAQVTFSPSPTISLEDSYVECDGQVVTLNPMVGDDNLNYSWTLNGNPAGESEVINVTLAGEYCLTASLPSGCGDMACTSVSFIPAPTADLGEDIFLCAPASVTLNPGDNDEQVSYNWSRNGIDVSTDPTLDVVSTATYAVSVTGGTCVSIDTIEVFITERPVVDLGEDFVLCEGASQNVSFDVEDDMTYAWLLDGSVFNSSNGNEHLVTEGGEYVVNLELNGCVGTDTLLVEFRENPIVNLGEDKIACIGSEVILDAGIENVNYTWSRNDATLSSSDKTLTISESGLYKITVTDDGGCMGIDEIQVDFIPGPTLDLGDAEVTFCEGNSYTINATTNGSSIRWERDGVELTGQTSFELEVNDDGVYKAYVTGESDCIVEDQVIVTVFDNPIISFDGDNMICAGDQAVLSAGSASNQYTWTDENNMTVSASSNLVTEDAGTYTVVATNANMCTATDNITVSVTELPTVMLDPTVAFCAGESIVLDSGSDAQQNQWYLNGNEINGANMAQLEIDQAGSYRLEATNGEDCTVSAIISASVNALPSVNLGENQDVCIGSEVTLSTDIEGTYMWSNNNTTNSITVSYDELATGMTNAYSLTVTDANNCSNSDEVVLTPIVESQFTLDGPEIVCEGDTVQLSVMAFDGGSTDLYQWEGPEGTLINNTGGTVSIAPVADATYTVSQVTACGETGNQLSTDIFIDMPDDDLSAGRDTCVIEGRSIDLVATGGVSYEWLSNDAIVSGSNTHNPEVMPMETTTFQVFITNQNGCTYLDSVEVCVLVDPLSLIKPINLITPNNDGKNDVLWFDGLTAFVDNRLRVYSRWGTVIYDKQGYQQSSETLFDGTRQGEELPADTYYYILEVEGKIIHKSQLTIVRD